MRSPHCSLLAILLVGCTDPDTNSRDALSYSDHPVVSDTADAALDVTPPSDHSDVGMTSEIETPLDGGSSPDSGRADVLAFMDGSLVADGDFEERRDVIADITDASSEPPEDTASMDTGAVDIHVDGDSGDGAFIRVDSGTPDGWIVCDESDGVRRSVNPATNADHCGGCNHRCCGRFCIMGECTADGPPGSTACPLSPEEERDRGCFGPVPVQTSDDVNNCGGCRRRCAEGQQCLHGYCVNR